MEVLKVVSKVGNAITYHFTDGSAGVWDLVKDQRGFLSVGPAHTLTTEQHLAVSNYNAQAEKPEGGWL